MSKLMDDFDTKLDMVESKLKKKLKEEERCFLSNQ